MRRRKKNHGINQEKENKGIVLTTPKSEKEI